VGFSLGALVIIDFLINKHFQKDAVLNLGPSNSTGNEFETDFAVFYAPAVRTHWFTKIPSFLWKSLSIPSASIPEYRSQNATPVAAYKSLLEMQEGLSKLVRTDPIKSRKALHFPAVVFLEPFDELVAFNPTIEWVKGLGLENWLISQVSARNAEHSRKFSHLIIDPKSVGILEWKRMIEVIERQIAEKTN
jgi:hypothetical protein